MHGLRAYYKRGAEMKISESSDGRSKIKHRLWTKVTIGCATVTAVFGLSMMIWPRPGIAYFNMLFFGSLRYPVSMGPAASEYLDFVYGVLGAVIIGWMSLLITLCLRSLKDQSSVGVALPPIAIWLVVDSVFSIVSGFWQNAASNILFAAVLAIPIWRMDVWRLRAAGAYRRLATTIHGVN
jgi:hypothetical protein